MLCGSHLYSKTFQCGDLHNNHIEHDIQTNGSPRERPIESNESSLPENGRNFYDKLVKPCTIGNKVVIISLHDNDAEESLNAYAFSDSLLQTLQQEVLSTNSGQSLAIALQIILL